MQYSKTCLQRSVRNYIIIRFSRDKLRLVFVDRKPLLAGVAMHRFDCIIKQVFYNAKSTDQYE